MKIHLATLFCIAALLPAWADDPAQVFTYDLQNPSANVSLPSWMPAPPTAAPASHASISFPINPVSGGADLAVTFCFTETTGGFLRVYWTGAQGGVMLGDNLFEGIGMPNQRTLLVKREVLSSPGTLTIQSSEKTLNISRIQWEWVDPAKVSLASGSKQTAFVNSTGGVFSEGDVDGSPPVPKPGQVGSTVVTASLTQKPERIESGVEFVATVQAAPDHARLEVEMAGVPIGSPVQLWVNRAYAGDVTLQVPDLNDPGYDAAAAGAAPHYTGWRKGSVFLPAGIIQAGDNPVQFVVKDAPADLPVAVKDLVIQLKYQSAPTSVTPVATGAAPDATPQPQSQPQSQPAPTPDPANYPGLINYRFDVSSRP